MTSENSSKEQTISRSAWAWAMVDWGNSAFATTVMAGFFPLFFKGYYSAGVDPTVSTARLGIASSVGGILIALLLPILGAIADQGSYKKRLLAIFTGLGIAMCLGLYWVAEGHWQMAVLMYVMASIGFAGSVAATDSLMPLVSNDGNVHRVSALGYSLGYLGGGLLFALNVLMFQQPSLFGIASGSDAIKISFALVGVWWALFTVPVFIWVKESQGVVAGSWVKSAAAGWAALWRTVQQLKAHRMVMLFLLGYFLYNDGVGTVIKMALDYGSSVGVQTGDLIKALLLVQFVGFPATLIFGKLATRYHPKTVIFVCIGVYFLTILLAFNMSNARDFYVLAVLIGLAQGSIQSVSRSYYAQLIPENRSGEFFGFFNMLGKFTGIIGPAMVGIVAYTTGSNRYGILSISILFLLGGMLLSRVHRVSKPRAG